MKGYKATYNMKCRDFLFEVGKTYEIEGKLKICKSGFHFCQKMEDTTNYYTPNDKFILLEVEALGIIQHEDIKSATNRIKILRVVPKEEYNFKTFEHEYDDRGNMISETSPIGRKWSRKYDDRNNMISETYPSGRKWLYEYDERNNLISEIYPDGGKWSYEYDDRNNMISETNPSGGKWSYKYDDQNNMISETSSNGRNYTY